MGITANEDGVRHEFLLDGVKILREAWGKVTLIKGENILIGAINPYRYRGYYFDHEIGLYITKFNKKDKYKYIIAVIHTHPNSNEFSRKDISIAKKTLLPSFLMTPSGHLKKYGDTRRGFKITEIGKIKCNKISKSTLKKLRKKYEKRWKEHIAKPCDFGCKYKKWPAW